VLTLDVDPAHGFSLLKVGSQTRNLQVDLFIASPVQLDFTGHTAWPAYVIARADWRDGKPTQARILTRATTASGPQEVLICRVSKPAADLVVEALFPTTRQPPLAFQGQAFGFMPEDAISDIVLGNSVTAEIVAARTSAHTGAHASLQDRINADLVGDSLADRLALRPYILIGNAKTLVTGTSTNVSGSFAATQREFEPKITIEPEGDETTEGAVTAPDDAVRNDCFVVNADNGQRVVNANGEPVFGKLAFATVTLPAGAQVCFYNASRTIDGNGTLPFQSPLAEGDIVQAPDGEFYEIEDFVDQDNATLGAAYQGAGNPDVATWAGLPSDPSIRRFTLSFFTVAGGVATLANASIRFGFPAFYRSDRSIYDGYLLLKKDGELPPVPNATETATGKALLAAADGKAGSFRSVEAAAVQIASHVHTLNFVYGNQVGSTVQDAGFGVCEVSIIGAKGPQGTNSGEGPQGPQGDPGYGWSTCNPFVPTGWLGLGAVTGSHTVDFSVLSPSIGNIRHLWGGFCAIEWDASSAPPLTYLELTNIVRVSNTTGRIDYSLTGPNAALCRFMVYLGACE
jgi:hypothetical protein